MSRDQVRSCQYGSPEFGLLRLVAERGTLWPRPSGGEPVGARGYDGSNGRPVRGVLPELVQTLRSTKLIHVDNLNGSIGITLGGKNTLAVEELEHSMIAEKYPYLEEFGYALSTSSADKLIKTHLPRRALNEPLACRRERDVLRGWPTRQWSTKGEIYGGRRLTKNDPAPPGEARVAALFPLAAAVQLVIEEYLRFDREPPSELLACAALCWAEDLLRQVPGYPLRSTGDRP